MRGICTRLLMVAALVLPGAAQAAPLTDLAPEGTLLYVGWPGTEAFGGAIKDTAFAKLLAEPEVVHLRSVLREKVWPVMLEQFREEASGEEPSLDALLSLLSSVWRYPTTLAIVGAASSDAGFEVDAFVAVRAGAGASKLLDEVDGLLRRASSESGLSEPQQVEAHGGTWMELGTPPGVPKVRYGRRGDDVLFVIGERVLAHLAAGGEAKTLTGGERFRAAMKATGGTETSPVFYVDARGVVELLDSLSPVFAAAGVPVLDEPGAAQRFLESVGLGNVQSLSFAMVPHANGFKSSFFLHAPGLRESNPMMDAAPLTNDDLRIVPRDAAWASVSNIDVLNSYRAILEVLRKLSAEAHGKAMAMISQFEQEHGLRVEEDLLAPIGDTWAFFDAPSHGTLLFTGITMVVETKPNHKLGDAMVKLAQAVAELAGAREQVSVRRETYRDTTIHYLNVAGAPFPIAPAWAQHGGRWVLALYPQVVRTTLDRMIDRNESLLDNPDFQRGRKLMPERFDTISYADTRATVQFIYPWLIPVAQTLIALGQGEGFEVDPTMLPSLACVMRHTFGEVSAGGLTDEGYLTVWHGSFPVNVGASAGPIAVGAVVAGIMAPSVARGRELSKRSVSISNLKEIGLASYLYAEKHNNRLPPNLQVLLDSELIEESVLRSPLADDDTAESYVYLGGNLQGEVADRIMAYEKPEHYDGEGTLVLFLDAHVEFVPLDQFEELLEETKKALDREPGQDAEPADEPTQPDDGGAELDPEEQLAIAQLLVRRGGPVATALEAYRKDVGQYPKYLAELGEPPSDEAERVRWKGPYLEEMMDPWSRKLEYRFPGRHNVRGYDLWSFGPDGENGTPDDINNWQNDQ